MKGSRTPKPVKKDLPPKSGGSVKGGKLAGNDNVTLVRAARVTTRRTRGGVQ